MRAALVFVCLSLVSVACNGETNVNDYVYWTKSDIAAWHWYFPRRVLDEEYSTNRMAYDTFQAMDYGFYDSLTMMTQYHKQELATAMLMMEGTSAQGCVNGIASYMENCVYQEVAQYKDCSADSKSKLDRLLSSWRNTNDNYQDVLRRTLEGIDNCVKRYPNKDSWSRLKMCVETWKSNYFSVANTIYNVFNSSSMSVFKDWGVTCSQTAARVVIAKGWRFIGMLVQCAKLSANLDSQAYDQDLTDGYFKYLTNVNLTEQLQTIESIYQSQVSSMEQIMMKYYDLQKSALEKYVIEPRERGYYESKLRDYMKDYVSSVTHIAADNPANLDCVTAATVALNDIAVTGSVQVLQCADNIVNNTKTLITEVNNYFEEMNIVLPSIGNVAILSCFSQGYIFAENTIYECYKLKLSSFNVKFTEVKKRIEDDVNILLGYEQFFDVSNDVLPCGESILPNVHLQDESVMYNLSRCLYINSGTNYSASTWSPS